MEAYGQIIFDLKNRFISQKKRFEYNSQRQQAIQKNSSIKNSTPKSLKKDLRSPPPPPPEEYFKFVRDEIKINQSANTPGRLELNNQKLDDLIDKCDTTLLKIETVWPFVFFTNDIIIDPHKVTIVFRDFFWAEQIHSVMVRDILDVVVETSLFFATLRIVDQGYIENSININYLKKDEALEARKVIQGLVVAHRQGIDFSKLETKNLKEQVTELGKVTELED